jgi:hypothetical protein
VSGGFSTLDISGDMTGFKCLRFINPRNSGRYARDKPVQEMPHNERNTSKEVEDRNWNIGTSQFDVVLSKVAKQRPSYSIAQKKQSGVDVDVATQDRFTSKDSW